MVVRLQTILTLAWVIPSVAGCCCGGPGCPPADSRVACPICLCDAGAPGEMPVAARLASYQEVDEALSPVEPPEARRLLTPEVCQCAAASNSPTANSLEMERQLVEERAASKGARAMRTLLLQRDLLMYRSIERRNAAAAQAMTAFYQLAEVEAHQATLLKGLEEVQLMIRRARRIRAQGVGDGVDLASLEVQRLELQDQLTQLQFNRIQLNGRLQELMDCPLTNVECFWPKTELKLELHVVDVEAEVERGLAARPELRVLRLTYRQLDTSTLPVARAVLSSADGPLGSPPLRSGWITDLLGRLNRTREVTFRQPQLQTLIRASEQLVSGAIRQAAYELETSQRRAALTNEKLALRRRRLEELEKQRLVGQASSFDISAARLSLYEAESELAQRVAAARIAEIRLQEAQGLLAGDCGFECHPRCEACCCRP